MKPITVGDVGISSIIERDGPWRRPGIMFPTCDTTVATAHLERMEPFIYAPESDLLVITYQTLVVRSPHHTILIDTCTGEDKGLPAPFDFPKQPWLDGFAAHGLSFEDIDYVFCTHLHVDHVGWNTRLIDGRWVPTFPNAQYVFARTEVAAAERLEPDLHRENVAPVIEAGQATLVDMDHQIEDGIWLEPTPGHTQGHVAIHLESAGAHAVMWGDLLHSPAQCAHPDWSYRRDWDGGVSTASRLSVLGACAEHGHMVLSSHFPSPSVGRIRPKGDAFWFAYEEQI